MTADSPVVSSVTGAAPAARRRVLASPQRAQERREHGRRGSGQRSAQEAGAHLVNVPLSVCREHGVLRAQVVALRAMGGGRGVGVGWGGAGCA